MKIKHIKPELYLVFLCLILSIFRVFAQWEMKYLFLVFNLFLAWLPYYFSTWIKKLQAWYLQYGLIALSILFLPNATYLVTDLIHFKHGTKPDIWFDLVLFFSYGLTGLIYTILCIDNLYRFLMSKWSVFWHKALVIALFPAIGCGIYLGRIVRLNSWDAIIHPFKFLAQLNEIVFSSKVFEMLEFTVLFALFSGAFFLFFQQIRQPIQVNNE